MPSFLARSIQVTVYHLRKTRRKVVFVFFKFVFYLTFFWKVKRQMLKIKVLA